MGTQDVLTCHVVVLRHEETGVTAFAHFDEYLRIQRLEAFLHKFQQMILHRTYYGYEDENENPDNWEWCEDSSEEEDSINDEDSDLFSDITLQLVGGYKEESGKGGVLSTRILTFFATQHLTFKLTLVCLGPVNTRRSRMGTSEPLVGGVLCDLSNGKLYPATFNRSFVDGMPDDTVKTLMLGPSLIKNPFKLKKMIIEHEDRGYSSKNTTSISV